MQAKFVYHLYYPESLHRRAKAKAAERGESLREFIIRAIERRLEEIKEEEKKGETLDS